MRRYAWVALILIAVSLGSSVRALPTHEVTHIYYDCAMNENGWRTLACNGQWYGTGTLSGAYLWEVIMGCNDFDYDAQWYYWNGSNWIEFEGPPGPNC